MVLLINDTTIGIGEITKEEKNLIVDRFTYNDMSGAITSAGFSAKKVKKVKFASSLKNNLVLKSGFLQELLIFCKENNIKATSVRDNRTRFDFQKEYSDEEIKHFLANFSYTDHHRDAIKKMLKVNCGIIKAPTSAGKCFGKDTEILMYDGSIKLVQDIKEDDVVMGWDSSPRNVKNIVTGVDKLYKIKYAKGNGFHIVNSSHILTLKSTRDLNKKIKKNYVIDISLKDYLNQSKDFKRVMKLFQEPVTCWKENSHFIDPYFLGIWLGDGNSSEPVITNADSEVINYLYEYINNFDGVSVKKYDYSNRTASYALTSSNGKKEKNPIMNELLDLNLIKNKHIPKSYLIDSYENRLKLLAGIIDTDGYLDKKRNVFEFSNKNKKLSEDVLFLSKSLGFYSSMSKVIKKSQNGTAGTYYVVYIAGDIEKVPTKIKRKQGSEKKKNKHSLKDPAKIGFNIIELNEGDYYGFTLDNKDGRFMLGDFIVSHNTEIITSFLKLTKIPTIVIIPGVDLAKQTYERFIASGLSCGLYTGKHSIEGYHSIALISSIGKIPDLPKYKCVICDESHSASAAKYQDFFSKSSYPLRYGFSATPQGNDKYKFATIRQYLGDVIYSISAEVLMENKVLTPPKIHMVNNVNPPAPDWVTTYEQAIVKNNNRNEKIKKIVEKHNMPTLIIFKNIEHGEILNKIIPNSLLLHGEHSSKEREEGINLFKTGEIKTLIASNIFKQGISINEIRVFINASGQKSVIDTLQKLGRALRKDEGKDVALVYDFTDTGNRFTEGHSAIRVKQYQDAEFKDITYINI